jgi:dihydroorotase
MRILLRQAYIADSHSSHNGLVKDVLIVDGIIKSIADKISESADIVVEEKNLHISQGWIDIFSHFNDPGFEYKETLETGAASAVAGGYTQVFVLPNTNPAIHTKSQVEYVVQKSTSLPVHVHPLGSITKNVEGKELAEMYDMKTSGAVAFSDGISPLQSAALMLKALQYVKAFNGLLVQVPVDKSFGQHGLMHEGITSTQLGLPGIPALAEELIIQRDIELLRYTESKLHLSGVSTAKGIELIEAAKKEGLNITCSVTPYHLFFCDEDLKSYDTNLKVNPPLRSKEDMLALREAVINGKVDCIASHHLPQNWDNKVCEFEYAKNGMIGLQTAYAAVQTILPQLSAERVAALFSTNVKAIFNLAINGIEEGSAAELTLFNNNASFSLIKENIQSKSSNTPFVDKDLTAKVIGIFVKGNLHLNK